MRKPRSDSKLLNLAEDQQSQLCDWLLSGIPLHKVRELVKEQFQVSTSLAALSGYYSTVCSSALLARRQRAMATADAIAAEASARPGQFDQATIDALKQRAFELAVAPQADPRDVKSLFTLVLKSRDQDLVERRVKLLETKAAQADAAAGALNDTKLTPEERMTRMKEIFGLA
jgi:hypothetical protein